jgi:plasmid stability protein
MRATIDLPEPVFGALRERAAEQGSSVEAVILEVIENALEPARRWADSRMRVRLPLVLSRRPGTLRSMTGGEIDDILG